MGCYMLCGVTSAVAACCVNNVNLTIKDFCKIYIRLILCHTKGDIGYLKYYVGTCEYCRLLVGTLLTISWFLSVYVDSDIHTLKLNLLKNFRVG